jgi:hypothetical protein
MEGSAPWPEGEKPTLAESVSGALSHIDALRHVVEAALAWRRCKYAMRAQTVGETQRRHDAIRFAERHLNEVLAELVGEGAAGRGVLDALTAEGESLGQYWEIEP